jgi:hypothetical protein
MVWREDNYAGRNQNKNSQTMLILVMFLMDNQLKITERKRYIYRERKSSKQREGERKRKGENERK